MKANRIIITVAALISLAAIVAVALALRDGSTAAVPADETSIEKKVAKNAPVKKRSAPARAKPVEASPVKEAKPNSAHRVAGEKAIEKADGEDADKKANSDNPFPRYLDMFKNNPEALVAEFEKEAEADRARQREMRNKAIAKLKLNAEQTEFFEKALDDLRDEITQQNREWAELVTSGRLNEDTAADGCIWSSNPLLAQRMVAAREMAVRETSEKLYEQLVIDGVSDAEVQNTLSRVVYNTSFSYECYEPDLAVYDKVYKNMGFGKGIFSWCVRPHPKQ
jgi:hypothetical protein